MDSRLQVLLDAGQLGAWIAGCRDIWQMDLLNTDKLADYCKDRGISIWKSHIELLWQLGFLRAEMVVSDTKLRRAGLTYLKTDERGYYLYADKRPIRKPGKDLGKTVTRLKPLPSSVQLLFHPFRYFVLYNLDRVFMLHIAPIQTLFPKRWYQKLLNSHFSWFQRWLQSNDAKKAILRWNDIASLAIATEPCFFNQLFGTLRWQTTLEAQRKAIERYWGELAELYKELSVDRIEEARRELCFDAEIIEPNQDVHTMLRLAKGERRLKLKGKLGGAILLKTMAEMLRRASEEALNIKLPEEDELRMPWRGKERLYGSQRILDGDRRVASEYLRQHSLDYGLRVRWYVEGDTEYGAVSWITEDMGARHVEVINLRGKVAQKGIVAFRDNLRADISAGIFSIISIDGDRSDYLRAVKKAAEDDEFCGEFFVSKPDFEFCNFTLSELEDVLWMLALERGADTNSRKLLHQAILNVKSGEELFGKAKAAIPELHRVSKGKEWGKRLMEYTWEKRQEDEEERPIVKAVKMAYWSKSYSYNISRKEYRVDPETGKTVKRS